MIYPNECHSNPSYKSDYCSVNRFHVTITNMPTQQKPADKFRDAMKQILSVSKEEIIRREDEYKRARALQKKKAT